MANVYETSVYCMYDRVAGFYSNIFLATNDGVACRSIKMQFGQNKTLMNDCELYKLAVFEQASGAFAPSSKPEFVCKCGDLIENE